MTLHHSFWRSVFREIDRLTGRDFIFSRLIFLQTFYPVFRSMSSTVIDKTVEEILGSGEHEDLQLDYDDAEAILDDEPEPSGVVPGIVCFIWGVLQKS